MKMKSVIILKDYKNKFGSKWDSHPYRSGLDKELLKNNFKNNGINCKFASFSRVPPLEELKKGRVLYTSSEDLGGFYKSFIEDVILNLERAGVRVIPSFDLLRAHNNKVYMELLRQRIGHRWKDNLQSRVFGTLEELEDNLDRVEFPTVIKTFAGALSRGVFKAENPAELRTICRKIARVRFIREDLKDRLRPLKHRGYVRESTHRKKFIVQRFLPGLENDWKILVYGKRLFILTRHVRENDFRASGSHCNYLAGSKSKLPAGILDYAVRIQKTLNVPHLSLDVVQEGKKFELVEFQALYFGTSTVNMSDVYFEKVGNQWRQVPKNNISIEKLYADAVVRFLNQ